MKKWNLEIDRGAIKCDICARHENMNIVKIKYYTQNYGSTRGLCLATITRTI